MWIADAQPGYHDSTGRWHAGVANGYYDGGGRWIATSAYRTNDGWNDVPRETRAREIWLQQRIRDGRDNGTLTGYEVSRSSRTLTMISQRDTRLRRSHSQLNRRDERSIQAQLDNLSARLRAQMRD